jgi:WD40 repeat protein
MLAGMMPDSPPSTVEPARSELLGEQTSATSPRFFGDYELLSEIARGGAGVVYKARQISLNRLAAVKMIAAGRLASPQAVERFHTETTASALLDHPNIIPIYQVGVEADVHYFSMKLIEGGTIADCRMKRGEDPATKQSEIARLLVLVARAVHYAHQRGILHRDLKPGNILLDTDGQPYVADFGLAKLIEADSSLTKSMTVMGTPAYMAPEQATGGSKHVTTAADVYGLGAILYELLSGRPPFQGESELQVLQKVQDKEPEPPVRMNPTVDSDLQTICLKCLQKDPEARYLSAEAVAQDLERWLAGDTIQARPAGTTERVWRWCRRKPALASLLAMVLVLMATVATVSTTMAVRLKLAGERTEEQRQAAVDKLWDSLLQQGRANRWSGRPGQRFGSLDALAEAAAIRPSIELRNEAIACMTLPDLRLGRTLDAYFPASTRMIDPAFKHYVTSDESGNLQLRRVSDDQDVLYLPGPGVPARVTHFSPDGKFLVSHYHRKGEDFPNQWWLWNLSTAKVVMTHSNCWSGQVFSPDNRYIVVLRRYEPSVVYSGKTLEELNQFDFRGRKYIDSSFSPDGSLLAVSGTRDPFVRVVEVDSGRVLQRLEHPQGVRRPAWHPNGRWLATPCGDGNIYLWDVERSEQLLSLRNHQDVASAVLFSSRGDILFSTAWDSTVRLWDVSLGRQLLVLSVRRPALQLSPDETLAGLGVKGERDQWALLEASTAKECRPLRQMLGQRQSTVQTAHISRDGRLLAAGSADGFRIWDLHTDGELAAISMGPVDSLRFLPDESGLITCGDDGLFFWPIQWVEDSISRGQIGPANSLAPGKFFRGLSLTADGSRILASQYPASGSTYPYHNLVIDVGSTKAPTVIKGPSTQGKAAITPDGRWMVTGIWRSDKISIWDVSDGTRQCYLTAEAAYYPDFSPDGRRVVAGTAKTFHSWEVGTWQKEYDVAPETAPSGQPSTATFSPDGTMVAVFQRFNLTHLVDATRGKLLATVDLERHIPRCFSPDGSLLVLATEGGQLKLLDLRMIREQLAEMNLDWDMPSYDPSPAREDLSPLTLSVVTNQVVEAAAVP